MKVMQIAAALLAALLFAGVVPVLLTGARGQKPAPALRLDELRVETVELPLSGLDAPLDRRVTVRGGPFFGTSFGPLVDFVRADGTVVAAAAVLLEDDATVVAYPPPGLRGACSVRVTNPDRTTVEGAISL